MNNKILITNLEQKLNLLNNEPKITLDKLLPLVREFYNLLNNLAGGHLHLILDDGNIGDDSIIFCIKQATENNDKVAETLGKLLLRCSKTQRIKCYKTSFGNNYE